MINVNKKQLKNGKNGKKVNEVDTLDINSLVDLTRRYSLNFLLPFLLFNSKKVLDFNGAINYQIKIKLHQSQVEALV